TAFCIADIAGHGAVAAVNMAITRSLLRVAIKKCTRDSRPCDVFMKLDKWLRYEFAPDQFVTMWLGFWDPRRSQLTFSCAAHPDAILWPRDGEPQFLESQRGLPLGLADVDTVPVESRSIDLRPGDRVFLYTDA